MLGIEIMKRLGGSSLAGIVLTDIYMAARIEVELTIAADGFTYRQRNYGPKNKSWAWINPQAGMSLYEVRMSFVSGDPPTDGSATGAWLSLSTDRSWLWAYDVGATGLMTVEIRRASDHVVVKTIAMQVNLSGV